VAVAVKDAYSIPVYAWVVVVNIDPPVANALALAANREADNVSEKVKSRMTDKPDVKNFIFLWFVVSKNYSTMGLALNKDTLPKLVGFLEGNWRLRFFKKENNRGNRHFQFHHKHNTFFGKRKFI